VDRCLVVQALQTQFGSAGFKNRLGGRVERYFQRNRIFLSIVSVSRLSSSTRTTHTSGGCSPLSLTSSGRLPSPIRRQRDYKPPAQRQVLLRWFVSSFVQPQSSI